ncbi:alpha/beta hydrolase [Pseudoalteromonas luteoviolacea]|uniref:Serine aminopeptidase S33 domain-containing protein n=1 Tax=Pseudoalteromonas luteoviolacea S4054 TaxID=1129367 RepID=A0A0F6A854_9GAMM|nr:alpha/beta hydrolase [Pseudoalteromonas luteoviolacea]AOT10673.1 hypothetical protein S4054249_22710 [Pseudoalteromonas luteoviolacea]AOT15258.1 hypothetical protein S40542_20885 [Pseudoalteromonas luteoviolacea]AOT20492.1 hypothetical protein S4054_22625 [Pseudoalteromonas luteoviolacea]KKE82041.1 hypothetical protein N479_20030 [Pseudoalteromonas luteoviolacea S4054]KZN67740.1 hypothetical protein N481_23885 [Pseudoalteromonas luteoviolacea S4047-1]
MKKLAIAFAATALTGCSVSINEKSFIRQDDTVTPYTKEFITKVDQITPNHVINMISIPLRDEGVELHGVHLDNPNTNNTILYIPGNGMSIENSAEKALVELAQYNLDIVVFDRRGLGASNGTSTIASLVKDAQLTFDYTQRQLQADKIVVHGFSLGSFVAAQVAKTKPIDGLVMQGSATNISEWIDKAVPWYKKLLVDVQVDDVFFTVDNKEVVSQFYSGPLLVIGGGEDKQTPVSLSHALYSASKSKDKEIVISDEAGHYQMFEDKQVRRSYDDFVMSL